MGGSPAAGSEGTGSGVDLEVAFRLLAVPEVDRAGVLTARADVDRDHSGPAADWVGQVADDLRSAMGRPTPGPVLPPRPVREPGRPGETGDSAYLPVVAFATVVPDLLAHHASLGVPEAVTADTLADVGRMLVRNRVWFGEAGLGAELGGWLTRHLHGALLQVGRLQLERMLLDQQTGVALQEAGLPCGPGDLALNLHIPGSGGPLTDEAVEGSLTAAREGFARWFPDESPTVVVCLSWLLDPQLRDVLPERSNLVAFQRRFSLTGRHDEAESSLRRFVFGDLTTPRADLVAGSGLGEAVLAHWRSGGEWYVRHGWFVLT